MRLNSVLLSASALAILATVLSLTLRGSCPYGPCPAIPTSSSEEDYDSCSGTASINGPTCNCTITKKILQTVVFEDGTNTQGYLTGTGVGATTQDCFDSTYVQNVYNECWPQFFDNPPLSDNGWVDENIANSPGINTTPDWCPPTGYPPYEQYTAFLSCQWSPTRTYNVPSTQYSCSY
jgi:hypothetical protein